MSSDASRLREVLHRQFGVVTTAQARAHGLGPGVERRLLRDGVLRRAPGGVLVADWVAPSWEQRVLEIALADRGLVLSHGTAARLHGLPGFARHEPIEVVVRSPRTAGMGTGVVVHRTRCPIDADIVRLGPARVLSVATTLVVLASSCSEETLSRALTGALAAGADAHGLRATAERWQRRGRRGAAPVQALLPA